MAYRRAADEDSTDESDEDYVPPEHVEIDEESGSGEADLEPSSGGDTDLDVRKRKRKRKIKVKAQRGKKKIKTDDLSDNNDETTSNETLVSLPRKSAPVVDNHVQTRHSSTIVSSEASSIGGNSSSASSPSQGNTNSAPDSLTSPSASSSKTAVEPQNTAAPAPATSNLTSVLAKLSGKKKPTVLEKSQAEWQKFKSSHGISGELAQHNKGKGGFLDRKDFLERANIREFEFSRTAPKRGNL